MSTALARQAPKSDLAVYLESNVNEIAKHCASTLNPATMLQATMICISKNPELGRCTPQSLLNAIIQPVSLGLSLVPSQGEAYLVPYWNSDLKVLEAEYQPGYRGLCKLARADGKIESIRAVVVHSRDEFSVQQEPVPSVFHKPNLTPGKGPLTHVYSVVTYMSGRKTYEVMDKAEVEEVRQKSKMKDKGAWKYSEGEMWKKVCIKRHCKQLDQTPALANAIEADNKEYDLDAPVVPQNNSGNGKGAYASEKNMEHVEKEVLRPYVDRINAKWLDKWTNQAGEVHPLIKSDLMNVWQMDGHLVKEACAQGRLHKESENTGRKAIGLYTAILWFRSDEDQAWMKEEMNAYQKRCWTNATEKLRRDEEAEQKASQTPSREPGDDDASEGDDMDDATVAEMKAKGYS